MAGLDPAIHRNKSPALLPGFFYPLSGPAMTPSLVMAGLVPAIHVFLFRGVQRRGCPAQGRAWRM